MQILPKNDLWTGVGQSGLEALSKISQMKMNEVLQRQNRDSMIASLGALGLNQKASTALSYLDPSTRELLVKNYPNILSANADVPSTGLSQDSAASIGQQQINPFSAKMSPYQEMQKALQQERLSEAKQQHLNTFYKKWNETVDSEYSKNRDLLSKVRELKGYLDSGKVAEGVKGYIPKFMQNAETQAFSSLADEVVGELLKGTGPASAFKIKFYQGTKPGIHLKSEAQREIVDRMEKTAQLRLAYGDIRNKILEENDFNIPKGLPQLVEKEYSKLINASNKSLMPSPEINSITREQQPVGKIDEGIKTTLPGTEESPIGTLARGAVRTGARVAENVASGAADLASAGLGLANWATGGAIPTYEKIQEKLPVSLPTSTEIKDKLSKITSGYTDPQSGTEEFLDNIVSAATSFLAPGKLIGPFSKAIRSLGAGEKAAKVASHVALPFSGSMSVGKALKLIGAQEAGKFTGEMAGFETPGQIATGALFSVLAGTKGFRNNLEALRDANKKAANNLFSKDRIDVLKPYIKINKIRDDISLSAHPAKKVIEDIAQDAMTELSHKAEVDSTIAVNDLIKAKENLNKHYKLATTEMVQGAKHLPESARPELGDMIRILNASISEAGEKNLPAGKAYAIYTDLHRGLVKIDQAREFIKDNMSLSMKNKTGPLKALIWGGPQEYARAVASLMKKPEAQQLYKRMIANAVQKNARAVAKDAVHLNAVLSK